MLFNSAAFLLFLPAVFFVYWSLDRAGRRSQNFLILVASYLFYGWWDWRFLLLILASSLVDYRIGAALGRSEEPLKRRLLLLVSLSVNLGLLGFFKYFGFFVDSAVDLLNAVGLSPNRPSLNVILPVGISFYTFQTLSYTIDIYRRQLTPCRDWVAFFAFVSFFPQLVAGPIERAGALLPQFLKPRSFDPEQASDGLRQGLWGMFKKVVIADNVAPAVNGIFADPASHNSPELLLGAFLFAIQIYCDFSGYSDIAIGTARLFGFRLRRNFAFPYFSRDIAEFWRRWHISLSSWFRDYVYIPLGGSRVGRVRLMRNVLITFTVSGLWHGADWTFIVWGFLNGLYFLPGLLRQKHKQHMDTVARGRWLPASRELLQIGTTFLLTLLAWVFFRAESLGAAIEYLRCFASGPWLAEPRFKLLTVTGLGFLFFEWFQRDRQHALELTRIPFVIRWLLYLILTTGILLYGALGENQFIYFQF